jgi:hypothetical protein
VAGAPAKINRLIELESSAYPQNIILQRAIEPLCVQHDLTLGCAISPKLSVRAAGT